MGTQVNRENAGNRNYFEGVMTFEESQRVTMLDTRRSSWGSSPTSTPPYAREQSALEAWRRERALNEAHARLTEYARRGQLGPVDEDKPDPLGR
jgi:hypothetical protein